MKDKKILELAKKNRTLQLQVESLKTKAAKAAEIALKMKKENDEMTSSPQSAAKTQKKPAGDTTLNLTSASGLLGQDLERKYKDLEKKVTKMRNEK